MDSKKICVILLKDYFAYYKEQIRYLKELAVPTGYIVDIMVVDAGKNIFSAYQHAMIKSNAKYKIYLKKRAVIVNKYFLYDVLGVFKKNIDIGLLGVRGTTQLSTDAIIENSTNLFGRLLYSDGEKAEGDFPENVKDVMLVTDDVIVTQYDLSWREDIFEGEDFIGASQSLEFKKNNYRCVVPKQNDFWVVTNKCNEIDDKEKETFLNEYSELIYPLVTILIPTFQRPKLFEIALESVLAQDYKNLDIFITDNSKDNRTENVMQKYLRDSRIKYVHNPNLDEFGNWEMAINYNNPKAEYVNWLMDDDKFLPNKISTMIDYFLANDDVSLVTSYRKLIDINGNELPDADFSEPIAESTTKFLGETIGKNILLKQKNFIGELTTALIKKEFLNNNKLGWTGREGRYFIADFSTWLKMMTGGNLIYIREPLSCFRIHNNQSQYSLHVNLVGSICWALEIQEAANNRIFLTNDEECRKAILLWMQKTSGLLHYMSPEFIQDEKKDYENLIKIYIQMSKSLNNNYCIKFDLIDGLIEC